MKNIKKIAAVVCLAASLVTVQQCISVKAAANQKRYSYHYEYGADKNNLDYTHEYTKYNHSSVYFNTSLNGDFVPAKDTFEVEVVKADKSETNTRKLYPFKTGGTYYLLNWILEESYGKPADCRLRFRSLYRDKVRNWYADGTWSPDGAAN